MCVCACANHGRFPPLAGHSRATSPPTSRPRSTRTTPTECMPSPGPPRGCSTSKRRVDALKHDRILYAFKRLV
eukprot:11084-Eustigmatos_ZCMA.PRE.1